MKYNVVIIGAGPAGYIAALRAGQLGLKTALIEKKDLGGMCLNWGCVPTKSIIESAKLFQKFKSASKFGIDGVDPKKLQFSWAKACNRSAKIVSQLVERIQDRLLQQSVEIIQGEAIITTANTISVNNRLIEAEYIIIATGSYPAKIKGSINEDSILRIDQLFSLNNIPDQLAIVGYGPVAVELAQFFAMINKQVTIVSEKRDLLPGIDKYLTDFIKSKLKNQKVRIVYADSVSWDDNDDVLIAGKARIKCDKVLNCSWRNAIVPKSDIQFTKEKGFLKTNLFFQTNHKNIYAVGDVNGESYLAHAASSQGVFAINNILGIHKELNRSIHPLNIYTSPELAQLGKTEQELKEMEIDYQVSSYPMAANAKAMAEDNCEGKIRILSEAKYGEVLGVQIIASNATDLISEASALMSVEATVYDVAKTMHAHPTTSEVFMEASTIGFSK